MAKKVDFGVILDPSRDPLLVILALLATPLGSIPAYLGTPSRPPK